MSIPTPPLTRPMRVVQADSMRGYNREPSWDEPLTLYYNETNNIRRLRLSEVSLNVAANKVFALPGIALKPGQVTDGLVRAEKRNGIQSSASEVKFKLVAPTDYEGALASPKLAALLKWLIASDVLLHYSLLDVLFWSILDIVESPQTEPRIAIDDIHRELKNELYFAVSMEPGKFHDITARLRISELEAN